jgi:hypothetical protein
MTRESTKRILELLDDGVFDAKTLVRDLLNYMSESDVAEFAHDNGYELDEDEDEEDIDYDYEDEDYDDGPSCVGGDFWRDPESGEMRLG